MKRNSVSTFPQELEEVFESNVDNAVLKLHKVKALTDVKYSKIRQLLSNVAMEALLEYASRWPVGHVSFVYLEENRKNGYEADAVLVKNALQRSEIKVNKLEV